MRFVQFRGGASCIVETTLCYGVTKRSQFDSLCGHSSTSAQTMLFTRLQAEDILNIGKLFPSHDIPWRELLLLAVTITIIYIILSRTLFPDEDEHPVPFTVPIPEQAREGWKGQELEQTDIKVCN